MQASRQGRRNDYIKKPFVAPPPSKSSYVPPIQKQEPVHKPYVREEDPEIKARQEQDRQAAEAVGLTGDAQPHVQPAAAAGEDEEDAPKPMSLKERMALLQEQQRKQAERNAEPPHKKERKPPVKKSSESSERALAPEAEDEEVDRARGGDAMERQSLELPRERPRVPSAQRQPAEPMSPMPVAPQHEILSGGEEADQSAAGETTEDDAGTIGPEDDEERSAPASAGVPMRVHDEHEGEETAKDADDEDEDEEEEEVDEEEQRKQRLRERMARLAGGPPGAGGGMFNPFGAPAPAAAAGTPKKKTSKNKASEEGDVPSASQLPPHQMIAIPGMGGAAMPRVQSPVESDGRQRGFGAPEPVGHEDVEDEREDEELAPPPPRRSTAEDRGAAPPVPKGEIVR